MAASAASEGNAFGPYVSVLISEQEEALSGLQGTFGSIQPPSSRADALRDELQQLLSEALDHVTDVRIAARRGELPALARIAEPLADDSDALDRFIQEHDG